jgi:hypothetical protein
VTRALRPDVVQFRMLAGILFAVAVTMALAALRYDDVCQKRRLAALETQCDELALKHDRAWARIDRLQNMVQDRGWRDSALLTQYDWRRPRPF